MNEPRLSRNFFVFVLIATTALFFYMVRDFLIPVLLAAVFCTLLAPLFDALVRKTGGRRALSALICCLLVIIGLVVPLYWVANLVAHEALDFYNSSEAQLRKFFEEGDAGPLGAMKRSVWFRTLHLDQFDWSASAQDAAKSAGTFLAEVIKATSSGTIHVVILLFLTLFTLFYFFRDSEKILPRIKYLIPLPEGHLDAIITRFSSVTRATMKGTLVIALVQGSLAAITLWAFGLDGAILWGVVATIMSILPVVGAWLVLYPAAVFLLLTGQIWQGILMIILTTVVIGGVDNFIRPRLVGHEAGMHDLMVFFSTLGGIAMFGAMGFIVGPVVAALFLAVLEIYAVEFKNVLDGLNDSPAPPAPLETAQASAAGAKRAEG
ncbi:MAG: AI-2E family transporter [Acidobacteriota bacterium]